jgi:hypothetical protein
MGGNVGGGEVEVCAVGVCGVEVMERDSVRLALVFALNTNTHMLVLVCMAAICGSECLTGVWQG